MRDTTELNRKRALKGIAPVEQCLHKFAPSCKMRLLGPDNLKAYTRRFVINQINIEESNHAN